MADKLLADVNICLDLLLDRRPFVESSGRIFELAEQGKLDLVVSGLSFDTLFYIMRPSMGAVKTTTVLQRFLTYVEVGQVDSWVVTQALQAGWNDLEDALQYYCAFQAECNFLITRNKPDFKQIEKRIVICSSEEYLSNQ